jgi:GMP synthase (glutamine-hydrolysing)
MMLVAVAAVCALSAVDAAEKSAAASDTDSRPWLLVSMAPGGTTGRCGRVLSTVRELSGNANGKIVHFSRVTPELVAEMQPSFVILSPQGTPWCRYGGESGIALQNFLWVLPLMAEEMDIPILGICGGHQALALAFGGKVGPIRGGEDDCLPYTRDRQVGVIGLTRTEPDPIFKGLQRDLRLSSSHYDEVKVLPPTFVLLASEKSSRIQIMRHATRPVYGIQGHPERFDHNRPDGGILVRNFLSIARMHNEMLRKLASGAPRLLISTLERAGLSGNW